MNDVNTTFDADAFMASTIDEPLATEFTRCPPGVYQAMIDDFNASEALEIVNFTYKQGDRAGSPGSMLKLTVPFVIQDAKVQAEMERDRVVVSKQMILDRDDAGRIATGKNKNVDLGRLRKAIGQEKAGPWSPVQLKGAGPLMVKVIHTQYDRKDGTKGTRVEVSDVAPIRA